jgi:hypothetical protein
VWGVAPVLLQRGQGNRVFLRVAVHRDDNIITTVFTFFANHSGNPPDGGVIEQDALHKSLKEVDQIIASPDVRKFMEQESFNLSRGQTSKQADRQ